jgi:hypothetical protein
MTRFAGNGAHAFGRNVQEVDAFSGRIGNSASHSPAAVDQRRGNAAPRELRREDRA